MGLQPEYLQTFLEKMEHVLCQPTSNEDWSKGNYKLHYEAMADWFQHERDWDWASVIQGSLMVFGWMPTILEGRTDRHLVITKEQASDVADALNAKDIEGIRKDFINLSPVGTSKFLHFWQPSAFAIWDSNVCVALTGDDRQSRSVPIFEEYTAAIRLCAETHGLSLKDVEQRLFWFGLNAKERKH